MSNFTLTYHECNQPRQKLQCGSLAFFYPFLQYPRYNSPHPFVCQEPLHFCLKKYMEFSKFQLTQISSQNRRIWSQWCLVTPLSRFNTKSVDYSFKFRNSKIAIYSSNPTSKLKIWSKTYLSQSSSWWLSTPGFSASSGIGWSEVKWDNLSLTWDTNSSLKISSPQSFSSNTFCQPRSTSFWSVISMPPGEISQFEASWSIWSKSWPENSISPFPQIFYFVSISLFITMMS